MRLRALASCLIAWALFCVYSAGSLAADKKKPRGTEASAASGASASAPAQAAESGVLTGTGQIAVNGNTVRAGATILNGSTVAAGPDGDASIDLGPLGRIQLRPNTTIKLTFDTKSCRVIMERCGSYTQFVPAGVSALVKMTKSEMTEVSVARAEVRLKTAEGKETTLLNTEENKVLHDLEEVSANGEAAFTVNCCGDCAPVGGGFIAAPVWGIVGLIGAGASAAVGVVTGGPTGGPTSGPPRASPVR